jgi:predicted nucleotidyltransferase|tara:strand:- start:7587 stop:8141 length:555 start_codon:yes stop_codon:yes gene_type:complete
MVQKIDSLHLEVILILIRNKIHLREIARILGESHSTILRKLNELIKRNIIETEPQGKNKLYSLKNNLMAKSTIYMAENYKLTKLLKEYPKLSIILDEVSKKTDDKLIILFGSYAKFSANNNSDIDIFIETGSRKVKDTIKEINSKLSVKIGPFDKDSFLIKEIIKNHVILRGVEEFYERTKLFG